MSGNQSYDTPQLACGHAHQYLVRFGSGYECSRCHDPGDGQRSLDECDDSMCKRSNGHPGQHMTRHAAERNGCLHPETSETTP